MNNPELDCLLKSAQVPERDEGYWGDFPQRVVVGLRRAPAPEAVIKTSWIPKLAWGLSLAAACVVVGFFVGHWQGRHDGVASNDVLQNEKMIREVMAVFPNRIRAIVQDENGMDLILSDAPDVPTSIPLWVRVCRGRQCLTLVTFSGQELEIAGQRVTVLSDARGGVILEGDRFAWASSDPELAPADLKIRARPLEFAALN